jgi:hypothetical protein
MLERLIWKGAIWAGFIAGIVFMMLEMAIGWKHVRTGARLGLLPDRRTACSGRNISLRAICTL